jgi:hypothetical protein
VSHAFCRAALRFRSSHPHQSGVYWFIAAEIPRIDVA